MNKVYLFTILILLSYYYSQSCRCLREMSVSESYKKADAIFSGKVLSIEDNPKSFQIVVTFRIIKVFKGDFKKRIVRLSTGRTSCDWIFTKDRNYLVYAESNKNYLSTHLCTRTSRLFQNIDISELNALCSC